MWVQNLTDKIYYTEINPIDGFGLGGHFSGTLRTYGIKISHSF